MTFRPGDEIGWVAAGEVIRVIPVSKLSSSPQKSGFAASLVRSGHRTFLHSLRMVLRYLPRQPNSQH
jgi:hypothetical protein